MLLLLVTAAVAAAAVGFFAHTRPSGGLPSAALLNGLARVRPLEPWPWRDWERVNFKPDACYRRRLQVWEQFAAMPEPVPVLMSWYHGLRLLVQMGNDLSRSLFVAGAFEANEFALLDRFLKPGMVFVDAGAHEGLYSVFAAQRIAPTGRVFAIEPSARERAVCQANLALNDLAATIIPCAVSATDGEAEFLISPGRHSGHNALEVFDRDSVRAVSRQTVPVRSLDSLAYEYEWTRLDVLKMDIEGGETLALRGGTRVFRDFRPLVIVEVSERGTGPQGSSYREFEARFGELGYRLYHFDYDTAMLVPGMANQAGDNLVGIPKELASPAGFEPALSP